MLNNYKILIVGYGYVGKAVAAAFKSDNITVIDPKYSRYRISDVKKHKFDIVFVCVDTPKKEKFNTLNTVLTDLNKSVQKNTIVCCKSTATPDFYNKATKKYKNLKIVFSPEYLSHWNNINDFLNQKFIIVGGPSEAAVTTANIMKSRLKKVKEIKTTDIKTAAFIKYSENAFLALKVTFANELYTIFKKLKCPGKFSDFAYMLGMDERIGKSHLQVPGRDTKFGWGGHCFEKDNYEFSKLPGSRLYKYIIALNKLHRTRK